MIILIGGQSHTGKTFLSQKLLELNAYPYMSLDHLKMGLIRAYKAFEVEDDKMVGEELWPLVRGIIDTCLENEQNLILEGVYLEPKRVKDILTNDILALYLVFSEEYIRKNFDKIIAYRDVIEKRKYKEDRDINAFIKDNRTLKDECIKYQLKYFEIKEDYLKEIEEVFVYIKENLDDKL